jgi:hypothetical protein
MVMWMEHEEGKSKGRRKVERKKGRMANQFHINFTNLCHMKLRILFDRIAVFCAFKYNEKLWMKRNEK